MSYPLTDVGNAERLLTKYRDKIRYLDGEWQTNVGGEWGETTPERILKYAVETVRSISEEFSYYDSTVEGFIRKSENMTRLKAMIKLAEALSE